MLKTRVYFWKANMNQTNEKPNPPKQSLRAKLEAITSNKRVQLAILLELKQSALRKQIKSKQ
jgi:hypothetical protein